MDLVQSTNIEHLLAQRDALKARLEAADKALADAKELYEKSPVGYSGPGDLYRKSFSLLGSPDGSFRNVEFNGAETLKGFDAAAWEYLMGASGMRTFMSADAKGKWSKAIQERKTPELTLDNIKATFSRLHESRGDLFEEGVVEAFRALSWDFKTNNPRMFGKRLILKGYGSVDRRMCARVDDLRRVMSIADGKPEPDHRQGIEAKFAYSTLKNAQSFEDELVAVKIYMNGNIHVAFKKPELVAKLNAILGKRCPNALPAARDSGPAR